MASDYLPGVYTRIGTEENPGTFRGGSGSGISNSMPPITVKPWVLKNDKWICADIGFLVVYSIFLLYGL